MLAVKGAEVSLSLCIGQGKAGGAIHATYSHVSLEERGPTIMKDLQLFLVLLCEMA